jgi:hypothetical protein
VKIDDAVSWPLAVVLLAASLVAAVAGALAGAAAARLRGPYLAGATLALAVGLPSLATKFSGFLGGTNGLAVAPPVPPASLGATFPLERWQAWIAGDRRLLQVRQRQRRRPRAQAQDDRPRRRLQPDQHGQGHQAAGAAGQGLRHARRPRDADAHKVVDFVNASKVPDLFVSSGCLCWDQPKDHPQTFGWQPDYVVEGKILGQWIAQKYKGKKVAYFVQNDDLGADGAKGLDKYVPKDQVVSRQTYEPGNTDIGPQMAKIKASGAQVVAMFTIPAYTALVELAGLKLDYHPQLVVSNVGSDPTTLKGLSRRSRRARRPAR